jgi:hypothetical protein
MKYTETIKRIGECVAPWAKAVFYLVRAYLEFGT